MKADFKSELPTLTALDERTYGFGRTILKLHLHKTHNNFNNNKNSLSLNWIKQSPPKG